MTVQQILIRIQPQKPLSRPAVYNYLKALKIKPIGARQKPQRYPEDSADRILQHLGLPHVVTMPQLRHARSASRRTR